MRSFKFFALVATLIATTTAIPIDRGYDSELVARDVGDIDARDVLNDAQAPLFSRDVESDFESIDARGLTDADELDAREFDDLLELEGRDLSDLAYEDDLFARAARTSKVNNVIKAQGQKQEKAQKKANANNKTAEKAAGKANAATPKPAKPADPKDPKQVAAYKKAGDDRKKAATKAGSQAVTQAVKDKKTQRTEKWASKPKGPATGPKPQGPARTKDQKAADRATKQADRKATGQHLKEAGKVTKNTEGLPGRKDSYTVAADNGKGTKQVSGKDVRKAVFNSNANQKYPVGQPGKEQPKTFNNDPYSPKHPDPKLAGKPTIPGLPPKKGVEYPVLSGSKSGWTGDQNPGSARVITQKGGPGQPDKLNGVIAHDPSKKGDSSDHYLVQKNAKK